MACAPYPLSLGSKHPLRGHPLRTGGSQQPPKQSDQKTACWDRVPENPPAGGFPQGCAGSALPPHRCHGENVTVLVTGLPIRRWLAKAAACTSRRQTRSLAGVPGCGVSYRGSLGRGVTLGNAACRRGGGGAGTRTRLRCTLCALVLTAGPARSFCYSCPFLQQRNPGSSTRANPRSHWCTQAEGG